MEEPEMGSEVADVAPPMAEVPMHEAEAVREMRELAAKGSGAKRIARERARPSCFDCTSHVILVPRANSTENLLMRKRTPQEKKQLSLKHDRRNSYGESPHGARKAIPLRKRLRSRAERHASKVPLVVVDEDPLAVDLAAARAERKRKNSWKKYPDQPLGDVLERKSKRRQRLQLSPRKRASIERARKREAGHERT